MARKNGVYLKHKIDALKRTKRSHQFPLQRKIIFHFPSTFMIVAGATTFLGHTCCFVLRCFFVNTQKVVKFSTPNPG